MNWYSRDNYVLSSEGDTTTEICQANSADNARFISAAPELLEALINLQREIHANHKMNVKKDFGLMVADSQASRAIYKAKGE